MVLLVLVMSLVLLEVVRMMNWMLSKVFEILDLEQLVC